MTIYLRNSMRKAGSLPGELVHIGSMRPERPDVIITRYGEEFYEERRTQTWPGAAELQREKGVLWVHMSGLNHINVVEAIGSHFGLHALVLEDILNTEQRAKFEDYGDYLFIVAKFHRCDHRAGKFLGEQVSIVLGKGFVLSFQESNFDAFSSTREYLRCGKGQFRRMGADYLAYALLDTVVDYYFIVLEEIGEIMEGFEDEMLVAPAPHVLRGIHELKGKLLYFRKSIWPLREALVALDRGGSPLLQKNTLLYMRDVYDHIVHAIDTTESYRDMIAGLIDIYLSSASNRLNEVMKVLTIISTIFIPLTFIAGVYGMNFKYMPELEWRWGYPAVWAVMVALGSGMLAYFWKKDWL